MFVSGRKARGTTSSDAWPQKLTSPEISLTSYNSVLCDEGRCDSSKRSAQTLRSFWIARNVRALRRVISKLGPEVY